MTTCNLCTKARRLLPLNLGENFEHHLNVCAACMKPFNRLHTKISRLRGSWGSDEALAVAYADLREMEHRALAGREVPQ